MGITVNAVDLYQEKPTIKGKTTWNLNLHW